MADFSHYTAQAVTDATTTEYSFVALYGDPSLVVAPCSKENLPFYINSLRRNLIESAGREEAGTIKVADQTAESIIAEEQAAMAADRDDIGRFCVKGWGKKPPIDSTGKTPEFTQEEGMAFVAALPPEQFTPFRNFLRNVYNFTPRSPLDDDIIEKVGN